MADPGATIRTVRVIARLNIGGPARHTTLLDAGLRRLGYDTLLVYGTPGEAEGSLEHLVADLALPARRVPRLGRRVRPWDDVRSFVTVLRILRETRPHVVHTHTAKAGALGRVAATVYNLGRRRRDRCAIVHTFHGHVLSGYFSPLGSQAVRWMERILGLMSDRIIAISESQKRDLVERFRVAPARKVVVVPLGLDLSPMYAVQSSPDARTLLGFDRDAFVVVYVGRFVPVKNVPLLLTAFAALVRMVPRARLALVGGGPLRATIEDQVRALGLSDTTKFLGWVEHLAPVYAAADLVVLTSNNEGTPVALIEAMAAGRSVVATRVGGVPDLVEDGTTGRLVPPGDAATLAATLADLAHDASGRAALGAAARESVRLRFGADRLVGDIDRLYRTLVSSRNGPTGNS